MPPDQGQMMETDLILAPLDAGPSACYSRPILEEEEQPLEPLRESIRIVSEEITDRLQIAVLLRAWSKRLQEGTDSDVCVKGVAMTQTRVFGLTADDLQPIVESIARGEAVDAFDITVSDPPLQGHPGYRSEKRHVHLAYRTHSSRRGNVDVFAKQLSEPGAEEAYHYEHLAGAQAPIPRMYGNLRNADGLEVLFLECVEPFTGEAAEFHLDEDKFHELLAAMARFSAIRPSGEYADRLRRDRAQYPGPMRKSWRRTMREFGQCLDAIWRHAMTGSLGESFQRFCSAPDDRSGRLKAFADSLVDPLARMDRGLSLSDFHHHHIGRRRGTGELLFFDLECVEYGPRFRLVAPWLSAENSESVYCCPRDELARHYLDCYMVRSGCRVSLREFLCEIRIVATAGYLSLFGADWWTRDLFPGPTNDTDKVRQRHREKCDQILSGLSGVLDQATRRG